MSSNDPFCVQARALLLREKSGVLSTLSVDVPGYPFGSVVPYYLDGQGNPLIYISDIGQHSKNIDHDGRVSITIQAGDDDDVQAVARLTLLADAENLDPDEQELKRRYGRFFPSSGDYTQAHGFFFCRLRVVKARYIGGFGDVFWFKADDLLLPNPFFSEDEEKAISHMNEDHMPFLQNCLPPMDDSVSHESRSVVMVGMDGEGFDLLSGMSHFRFSFPKPVQNLKEARTVFKSMA